MPSKKRKVAADWVVLLDGPSADPAPFEYAGAPDKLKIPVPRGMDFTTYVKVETVIDGERPVAHYRAEPSRNPA